MLFHEGHALFKSTLLAPHKCFVWNINWLCWLAALDSILKHHSCRAGVCDSSHSVFFFVLFSVLPTIWPSADNSLATAQRGFAQEGFSTLSVTSQWKKAGPTCTKIKTITWPKTTGLWMDFSVLHTLYCSSVYYGSMFIAVTGHIKCLFFFNTQASSSHVIAHWLSLMLKLWHLNWHN